jgi:hypothetical protein
MKQTFILVACITLGSCVGCSKDPDETAIRHLIETMRSSAEEKHFDATLAEVAEDYTDNFSQKAEDLPIRLERTFASYPKLKISVTIQKLKKTSAQALATLRIVVSDWKDGRVETYKHSNWDVIKGRPYNHFGS